MIYVEKMLCVNNNFAIIKRKNIKKKYKNILKNIFLKIKS